MLGGHQPHTSDKTRITVSSSSQVAFGSRYFSTRSMSLFFIGAYKRFLTIIQNAQSWREIAKIVEVSHVANSGEILPGRKRVPV